MRAFEPLNTSLPSSLRRLTRAALLALSAAGLPGAAAQATLPVAPPAGEDTLVLSPFEVRADTDVGYQAGNTTSGSTFRLRTGRQTP